MISKAPKLLFQKTRSYSFLRWEIYAFCGECKKFQTHRVELFDDNSVGIECPSCMEFQAWDTPALTPDWVTGP